MDKGNENYANFAKFSRSFIGGSFESICLGKKRVLPYSKFGIKCFGIYF